MNPHSKNQLLNQLLSKTEIEFILIDHGLCPDWSRGEHTRRRDSMYLILDGEGRITIDGRNIYPKKNDMVLLPKGSKVSLYSENETCYNKYWCDFNARIDGRSLFSIIDFPNMIHLDDISHAQAMFERLDELHLRNDVSSAFMINAAMFELLAMFLKNTENAAKKSTKSDLYVKRVTEYIQRNIDKHITVKELAAETRYNEKYFIELFKKCFGTTPAHYIKSLRMEKAKRELLYTDCKISSLIDTIGYSTVQMFSRDFKAYSGFTPTEFRKKFK